MLQPFGNVIALRRQNVLRWVSQNVLAFNLQPLDAVLHRVSLSGAADELNRVVQIVGGQPYLIACNQRAVCRVVPFAAQMQGALGADRQFDGLFCIQYQSHFIKAFA